MADIDNELNQIKNAVYGRDVRGSIHDGIDKINKESEASKAKADEAYEVTRDILDESFDSAALEANMEQRIDDKIDNLQPEWTQFKDDTEQNFNNVETQLADKANKAEVNDLASDKADKSYVDNELVNVDNRVSDLENQVGRTIVKVGNWRIEENQSLGSLDFRVI